MEKNLPRTRVLHSSPWQTLQEPLPAMLANAKLFSSALKLWFSIGGILIASQHSTQQRGRYKWEFWLVEDRHHHRLFQSSVARPFTNRWWNGHHWSKRHCQEILFNKNESLIFRPIFLWGSVRRRGDGQ